MAPFVNREAELDSFRQLLDHDEQRILLLHGPDGIGKTSVVQQLLRSSQQEQAVVILLDFRRHRMLTEGRAIIAHLRQRIGGDFAQAFAAIQDQQAADLPAEFTEALSSGLLAARGGGSGASIGGSVSVQGDFVGRDQITFVNPTIVLDPGRGEGLRNEEMETRHNTIFRSALAKLQTDQRVILFLDHYEEASEEAQSWLRRSLVDLHLDQPGAFPQLWIIVAGRQVPLQHEVDQWEFVLRHVPLAPLAEEAVRQFWVEEHKLDPSLLPVILDLSGGHPKTLAVMAKNWAQRASGRSE